MKRNGLLLAATIMLTACQVPGGLDLAVDRDKDQKTTVRPKATATPSADAKQLQEPQAELDLLQAPEGDHEALSGTISIDAHYLLGLGQGKLIGGAGGNVISAGGGNLIGGAGGNLIGGAGGNLIGGAGGNLIGGAGGNLIGKRKYGLFDTDTLAFGTVLPAAEMEIQAVSMADGKVLPLGVDAEGEAVLSIYSNLSSHFTIYLPATITGQNVLVVARVPGASSDRLTYNLLTSHGSEKAAAIDEDSAVATAFLREAFVSRLERLFKQSFDHQWAPDGHGTGTIVTNGFEDLLPTNLKPLGQPIAERLTQASLSAGLESLSQAALRKRAQRTADALLAYVDMETIKIDRSKVTIEGVPDMAVPALVGLMRTFREAATVKMAADRDYFNQQPYVVAANQARSAAGLAPLTIEKPADVGTFLMQEVLPNTDRGYVVETLTEILASADLDVRHKDTLNAIMDGLLLRIAFVMVTDKAADGDPSGLKPLDAAVKAITTPD